MTNHAPRGTASLLKTLAAALMLGATFGIAGPAFAQDTTTTAAPDAPAADAPAADAPAAGTPADAAAAPAQPQSVDPKAVVATVGDDPITEADISYAGDDLQQQLQQMPPEQQRAFLVSVLIDMKLMAKAARDASLDKSDEYTSRLNYLEERELRRIYFAEHIGNAVTQDAIKAAYDKYVAAFKPEQEVHARHILVKTKEEADQVEADLKAGKPFEIEAMAKTTDPSGKQNGGDLGYFTHEQMVPPFADAAFALEPGKISDPVQTQYGWHVIKVEDKRMSSPTPLEQMAQQLSQQVLFDAFDAEMASLKKNVTVSIPDAALAAEVKAQSEPQSDGEQAPAAEAPAEAAPAQ